MKLKFWGTRGSLPVSLTASEVRAKVRAALVAAAESAAAGEVVDTPEKIDALIETLPFDVAGTYGGHSSCVELIGDGAEHVLCDLGTGARPFAGSVLRRFGATPQTFHIFMSHLHWDHIMGFPFFTPAYIPGNRIHIYGCHQELEEAFRRQQAAPSFPVDFSALGADIEFHVLEPEREYQIAGFSVRASLQLHEGDSYGWRFERAGRSVVYSTDSEHKLGDAETWNRVVNFFRGADLVIFDAMYSLADAISVRADWGHSSNIVGVELCQQAGVETLCMFHHEPVNGDGKLEALLAETRRFEEITRDALLPGDELGRPVEVISAYDGLELSL